MEVQAACSSPNDNSDGHSLTSDAAHGSLRPENRYEDALNANSDFAIMSDQLYPHTPSLIVRRSAALGTAMIAERSANLSLLLSDSTSSSQRSADAEEHCVHISSLSGSISASIDSERVSLTQFVSSTSFSNGSGSGSERAIDMCNLSNAFVVSSRNDSSLDSSGYSMQVNVSQPTTDSSSSNECKSSLIGTESRQPTSTSVSCNCHAHLAPTNTPRRTSESESVEKAVCFAEPISNYPNQNAYFFESTPIAHCHLATACVEQSTILNIWNHTAPADTAKSTGQYRQSSQLQRSTLTRPRFVPRIAPGDVTSTSEERRTRTFRTSQKQSRRHSVHTTAIGAKHRRSTRTTQPQMQKMPIWIVNDPKLKRQVSLSRANNSPYYKQKRRDLQNRLKLNASNSGTQDHIAPGHV